MSCLRIWAMVSLRSLTILTFKFNDRNLSLYFSVLIVIIFVGFVCNCVSVVVFACNVTSFFVICLFNAGRKLSAMFLFISNVLIVLYVFGR